MTWWGLRFLAILFINRRVHPSTLFRMNGFEEPDLSRPKQRETSRKLPPFFLAGVETAPLQ